LVLIISGGYNRDTAIFTLFDHNFVELGLSLCACGRLGVVGLCVKSQKQNGNAKKVAADDDYRWVQKHAQHQ